MLRVSAFIVGKLNMILPVGLEVKSLQRCVKWKSGNQCQQFHNFNTPVLLSMKAGESWTASQLC
jgi:hypothetical protein